MNLLPAEEVSTITAKPDQLLAASSKQFEICCYQLHCSEACVIPTSQVRLSATSIVSFSSTSEGRFTAISLLPVRPVGQRGEREYGRVVRPSMAEHQK